MSKTFPISPLISGKQLHLEVEKIPAPEGFERYRIEERGRVIVLQNNRLFWRLRGLKHRKGEWKVVEGSFKFQSAMEVICRAIENADPLE